MSSWHYVYWLLQGWRTKHTYIKQRDGVERRYVLLLVVKNNNGYETVEGFTKAGARDVTHEV